MPLIKSGSKPAISSHIRDIRKMCVICGAEFLCARHRQTVAKYCGRPCYYKAMAKIGSVELACDVCGKVYRRSPSHSHYITKTCSLRCRGIATRTAAPISKDFPSVRRWMARRGLISQCSECRYDEHPEILVVHHVDRDRTNNDLANLKILCPNCHALEHYIENRNGWTHASTARRKQNRDLVEHLGDDSGGT